MKIRTLCLTSILPIFALLGIATGLLVFFFEHREIYWGLSQEASGLAVSTAEFINEDTLNVLSDELEASPEKKTLLKTLERIVKTCGIQRIALIRLVDKQLMIDTGPSATQHFDLPGKPLSGKSVATVYMPANRRSEAVLRAFTRITRQNGKDSKYALMSEVSGKPLSNLYANIFGELQVYFLAALSVGVLCSLIISSILTRAIRNLAQSAESVRDLAQSVEFVAVSNYGNRRHARNSLVREINDLWNTFQTAVSVLRGVIADSRHQLFNTDFSRTEDDLVKSFSNSFDLSGSLTHGTARWAVINVLDDHPETVADMFVSEGTLLVIAGEVALSRTRLQTAVTASALAGHLRRQVPVSSPRSVLDEIIVMFDVVCLRAIVYNDSDNEIQVYEYKQEIGHFKKTVMALPDKPMLIHDMNSAVGERLSNFASSFGNLSCDDLLENIIVLSREYEDGIHGAMILIAPEQRKELD